jgi:hypothetical protein
LINPLPPTLPTPPFVSSEVETLVRRCLDFARHERGGNSGPIASASQKLNVGSRPVAAVRRTALWGSYPTPARKLAV